VEGRRGMSSVWGAESSMTRRMMTYPISLEHSKRGRQTHCILGERVMGGGKEKEFAAFFQR